MSLPTPELHGSFLAALEGGVVAHSGMAHKPLDLDLAPPHPLRLRVYLYNLVGGVGTVRDTEYKAVLRVRGQKVGEYGEFSHSGGRLALVVGYLHDLDVFVLWDASLHGRFKYGGSIQVKTETVLQAAATGWARQLRRLTNVEATEVVLACQSSTLAEVLVDRVMLTGGLSDTYAPR